MKLLEQQVISNNYDATKKRNSLSSYARMLKKITNKFTAELLLRGDIVDAKILPIMPMFGISYQPIKAENLKIKFNISKNYNIPSLNDLYWYPGGNVNLLPEKGSEMELGMSYKKNLLNNVLVSFNLSAYASLIDDWIVWLPGDYRYWSPQNVDEVMARGIEVSAHASGKIGNVNYTAFAEYAYTRTTNNSAKAKADGISDIQLIYVPINTANGYLNIGWNGFSANWNIIYTGSRNTSLNNEDDYSFTLPYHTINNFSIGKSFKVNKNNFSLKAKVNNIFNVDYQAVLWRAMPGINFELSFKLTI